MGLTSSSQGLHVGNCDILSYDNHMNHIVTTNRCLQAPNQPWSTKPLGPSRHPPHSGLRKVKHTQWTPPERRETLSPSGNTESVWRYGRECMMIMMQAYQDPRVSRCNCMNQPNGTVGTSRLALENTARKYHWLRDGDTMVFLVRRWYAANFLITIPGNRNLIESATSQRERPDLVEFG